MRYLKIRQTERSLKDIMISVSLGHTSYKRGRCGSSNMANMFPEISHRLEFYEIFENEVYLSPKIHLDIQILADIWLILPLLVCWDSYTLILLLKLRLLGLYSVHHSIIIFPRGPDSVPHSHAVANLVQGELKLNIIILGSISYQCLTLLKTLLRVRCEILWF